MKSEYQDGHGNSGRGTTAEQKKPGPLRYLQPIVDKWSIRERLALATAVMQDNDKHWPSISRTVKPFATEKRDEDYFAPRQCARQYADLLENIEQPKRRGEASIYDCTPEEMLIKRLTLDRIEELQANINQLQEDFKTTKAEINSIKNGSIDSKIFTRMFNELKEKEKQSATIETLIPVSESDLERLNSSENETKETPTPTETAPLDNADLTVDVIDARDLGVAVDDDYDNDSAKMEETRQEVVRAIAGAPQEIKCEEMEDEPEEVVESSSKKAKMEVKQEMETVEVPVKQTENSPNKSIEEVPVPQSPTPSSPSSPMQALRPPVADTYEDVDDEATEGEEDDDDEEQEEKSALQVKEKSYRTWKKSINMIIRAAQSHKHASVFLSPVTDDIAAGYSQVINRPMDLSTIKRRVDNGEIRTTPEFQRDVMLMFTNAVMYNNAEHDVHKMALEMYDDVMYHIEQYLSTQVMSPSVESKVLRRRASDHNLHKVPKQSREDEQSRRRCGSADSDKREEPPKKTRK